MTDSPSDVAGSRRHFLAALGAVSLAGTAGCLGGDDDGPATVVATVTARNVNDEEGTIVDTEDTIESGDFHGWEFTLDGSHEIDVEVEVADGPNVSVYIMEPSELDALEQGEEFEAIEGAIWTRVDSIDETVVLDGGEYMFVIVNADVTPANA